MARPRGDVIDRTVVGAYHCTTRCVRQLFLLEDNPKSLEENGSRWEFCENRLKCLAGIFAVDVLDYAFMSNHIHSSLRNRPDTVKTWTDEEIARRWLTLHPPATQKREKRLELVAKEIEALQRDTETMAKARRNLSCISYFQKCFLEPIAREMNRRDGTKGHFVAERFHCKRIEGDAALLVCSVYISLNPYRAGLGDRIEAHPYSSYARRHHGIADWLAPVFLDERSASYGQFTAVEVGPGGTRRLCAAANPFPAPRCSDKGFLALSWGNFRKICEWTADHLRPRRTLGRSAVPPPVPTEVSNILVHAGIDPDYWVRSIDQYSEIFHGFVAAPDRMEEIARRLNQRYLKGTRACAALHCKPPDRAAGGSG